MKLYKFRSLENYKRVKKILLSGKFYLAQWRDLNDPMEGLFKYIVSESQKELNNNEDLKKFINGKHHLKVCSFSNTYKPILLWSHYANKHTGIAIQVTLNSKHYNQLHKVEYTKNIPILTSSDLNHNPEIVLTKKIKIWKYEREYRVISEEQNVKIGKITGIILGIRTDNRLAKKLKNDFNHIPIYSTKLDVNRNRIEIN